MQQHANPNKYAPPAQPPEFPFGSNDVRLSPGEWLVAAIVLTSQIDYGLQTAFTTALVLTVIAITYPDEGALFGERLLDAMAGIGIAMVVEYARLMPALRRDSKEG